MNAPNDQQASRDNGKDDRAGTQKPRSETVECVAQPARYQTLAGTMPTQSGDSETGEHTGESAVKKKVAVFIAHGMGQQLPYDTQTRLALELRNHLMPGSKPGPKSRLRPGQVLIGDQRYSRVEFEVPATDNRPAREVHVYEAYWAPLTEGQVRIRDVTGFLFRSGLNGLKFARKPLRRWLFGEPVEFQHVNTAWLKIQLWLALLFVSSLVLLNTVIGLVAAARFLGESRESSYWHVERIAALSGALVPLLAVALALLVWWAIAGGWKKLCPSSLGESAKWRAWNVFGAVLVGAAVVLAILTGGVFVWLLTGAEFTKGKWACAVAQWAQPFHSWFRLLWLLLFALSYGVRRQMVQYLGDVVIYLSTHVLDRFDELRKKIRQEVLRTLLAIYQAGANGRPVYGRVIVVGHSLGSVAGYDALNELLLEDAFADGALGVRNRTGGFVTFGSPLDKTAYFFTSRSSRRSISRSSRRSDEAWNDTRQALAHARQPMVNDDGARCFPWVNVYSRWDIISGALHYYDGKQKPANPWRVENLEDPDALMPLLAHNEYWEGPTLYREIAKML